MIATAVVRIGLFTLMAAASKGPGPGRSSDIPPATAQDLIDKSSMEIGGGELDAAERDARQGLKLFPRDPGFHFTIGEVDYKRKQYAEAFYEYQWELFRSGPESQFGAASGARIKQMMDETRGVEHDDIQLVVEAIALSSSEKPGDVKLALQHLQTVEKTRGDRFALKLLTAEALMNDDQPAAAEKIYRELITRDPNFVAGYVELAAALDKQDKKKEADDLRQRAREIDPDNWRLKAM